MKKIVLIFSLLFAIVFTNSVPSRFNSESGNIVELLANESNKDYKKGIVNITTSNNLINASGIIVEQVNNEIYIATSSLNYNDSYNYEVIFEDYNRKKASVVGIVREDYLLILKVVMSDDINYKITYGRSSELSVLKDIIIAGRNKSNIELVNGTINYVGLCRNCDEDTYAKYYYSLLSLEIDQTLYGAGIIDQNGRLLGMITNENNNFRNGVAFLDIDKIRVVVYNFLNYGNYKKNYIKYNLLNVNSLTNEEKYLYSLDEGLTTGVLVSSVHYLNYFFGGLNMGMVIVEANGIKVNNSYELDNVLANYPRNSVVKLKVLSFSKYRTYSLEL